MRSSLGRNTVDSWGVTGHVAIRSPGGAAGVFIGEQPLDGIQDFVTGDTYRVDVKERGGVLLLFMSIFIINADT